MKKLGFTLAEVLITLVIIGVIAAMTVPTLMNNTQGQENKTAFKKAISSMNQALTLEYALEGNTAASTNIADIMRRRTNVINTAAAWPGTNPVTGGTVIATADGIIYNLPATASDTACSGEPTVNSTTGELDANFDIYSATSCGTGAVDVNGVKGPNTAVTNSAKPEDQFQFLIFETKVVPGTSAASVEAAVMYDNKTATATSGS